MTTFGRFSCHVLRVVNLILVSPGWPETPGVYPSLGSPNFQLPLQASVVVPWCWPSSIENFEVSLQFEVFKVFSKWVWKKATQPTRPTLITPTTGNTVVLVVSFQESQKKGCSACATTVARSWNLTLPKVILGKHNSVAPAPSKRYL